tara:strand:- start:3081 stop:3413 length:333 start_codon:yes stop_codon:yes gene_type:complete
MNKTINSILKKYYGLCPPAKVYLLISLVSFVAMLYQNTLVATTYNIGSYSVKLNHNNNILFFIKLIYIMLWTFILNELCRNGWKSVSWLLVLFPILMMFIFISILILANV